MFLSFLIIFIFTILSTLLFIVCFCHIYRKEIMKLSKIGLKESLIFQFSCAIARVWLLEGKPSKCHCVENRISIKDLFSKCDQICRKLRIWSHLLQKSLMEKFIFLCNVSKGRLMSTANVREIYANLNLFHNSSCNSYIQFLVVIIYFHFSVSKWKLSKGESVNILWGIVVKISFCFLFLWECGKKPKMILFYKIKVKHLHKYPTALL